MFYSTQILAKKGPLGTIWIASHLERRLKRSQVFDADIGASVDSIINPEAPLALRLSGQLLLGVVKIHARKVAYLFADASDALGRAAAAFDRADVDLADADAAAPLAAITLPGDFVDALLGGGGDGGRGAGLAADAFAASLGPGGAASFSRTLAGDSSFLLACDASTLLPSSLHPSSLDGGGVFDVAGAVAERALSVGGAGGELLRDAAALPAASTLAASGLFGADPSGKVGGGGGADPSTRLGDTDVLEAPPDLGAGGGGFYDDDDDGGGGADVGGGDGWGADDLPTPGGLPPTPSDGAGVSPALVASRRLAAGRRVRPRLDADERSGAPATQLPGAGIRALLEDPSPLLRPPAPPAAAAAALATPFDAACGAAVADMAVDAQALARATTRAPAGVALLGRPLFAPFMHPALFAAVVAAAPRPPPRAPRKRPAPGDEAAAATPATPAAPADSGGDAGGWGCDNDGWGGAAADDDDGDGVVGGWGATPAARTTDDGDAGDAPAAFTARTTATLARVRAACGGGDGTTSVAALAAGCTRLDAARAFFEVLVLRSRGYVSVEQGEPYGDVTLRLVEAAA